MGRHANGPATPWRGVRLPDPQPSATAARKATGGLGPLGKVGVLAAGLVTLVGAAMLLGPQQALADLPWAGGSSCTAETVDVVVSPEVLPVAQTVLAPVRGREVENRDGGTACVSLQLRAQEPQETLAGADLLPVDRAPQLWIPDSDVWGAKAERWQPQVVGNLASTPVVVTTSRAAAEKLGWADGSPTWNDVLRGKRSVAVPDFRAQSESINALMALWRSLGQGSEADEAVVATVFAGDREEIPSPDRALANARSGSSMAAVIPSTEQAVAAINAGSTQSNLVAVYPAEGSPLLNYPVLRPSQALSPGRAAAVEAVVAELLSERSRAEVRRAGFRDPSGGQAVGAGIDPTRSKVLETPAEEQVDAIVARIERLARPTRILAVLDVSLSMQARLDDGISRIALNAAAARLGANTLPDSSYVGAWVFASNMGGGKDYRELAPVKRLGSVTKEGLSHRSHLMQLANEPERYLTGGGTSLYDVALASFREMHREFDPKAQNAVILMSDGANEDSVSISRSGLLAEIRAANRGKQKVAIYTAGLGPDADYDALEAIAKTSGGHSYRIDTAGEGQAALLDGLRRNYDLNGLE